MSAIRDNDPKSKPVFSNVFELRKNRNNSSPAGAASALPPTPRPSSRNVLKTQDVKKNTFGEIQVSPYIPSQMNSKRAIAAYRSQTEGLKENLKTLQDLHHKLKFLLKELEEAIDD